MVLSELAERSQKTAGRAGLGRARARQRATLFAANLYERLAAGDDLAHAVAYARLGLGHSDRLPESPGPGPRSRHWDLARLTLDHGGGGALATADGRRRLVGRGQPSRPSRHQGRAAKDGGTMPALSFQKAYA
jgi:hypothetical protein